jgi:hypothetical protein
MTVTADNEKRVLLPAARPGDRFDVEVSPEGFVLRRVEPVTAPAKVVIEKRQGFTVGRLGHPIDEQALRNALADFP